MRGDDTGGTQSPLPLLDCKCLAFQIDNVEETAATANPRRPANVRGFAFFGHSSSFPHDQRVQAFRWDQPTPTNADCVQLTCGDEFINFRSP